MVFFLSVFSSNSNIPLLLRGFPGLFIKNSLPYMVGKSCKYVEIAVTIIYFCAIDMKRNSNSLLKMSIFEKINVYL